MHRAPLTLALLAALPASAALADTLRVPNEFEDIQAAFDAADPGDTVVIAGGSYTIDGLRLAPGRDGVMIRGQGRVFIDGPFAGGGGDPPPALEILSADVTIRGVTFRHAGDDAVVVGSDATPVDGFRMERCVVRNAGRSAVVGFGNGATIRGNRVRGCHQGAVEWTGADVTICRTRMEQLGGFGVKATVERLEYARNSMRTVEDGRGLVVTGDDAVIERSTFFGVQRQHVEVFGNGASVVRCTFKLGDNGAIDISGTNARIERNRIEATGNTGIALLGENGTITRNSLRDIGAVTFDDDRFGDLPNNEGDPNCNTESGECDTDSRGIAAYGANLTVTNNLLQGLSRRGVRVEGDEAVVVSNRILNTTRSGLSVVGQGVRVERNVVLAGDAGITVVGDRAGITRNTVLAAGDDATGIVLNGDAISVVANRVSNSNGPGMSLSTSGSTIASNVVSDCGSEDETGIQLSGDENVIRDNQVTGCDSTGLRISGNDNVATANRLVDNSDNGIWVRDDATGTVLERNSCRDNAGEGLDNRGTDTRIANNLFRGNRLDLTNRTSEGATLIDEGGNRFTTGGLTTEPEVGVSN